jgi:hypothetical protein
MELPSVYTQVYGQIPEFFQKIQEGQAPTSFTQQHLKDIGFASTNHRAFIPILKALGFLSPGGTPTTRYNDYRATSQSRQIMGEAIKETYSDLFLIKSHPKESDKSLIEGKFKSTHNAKDRAAELMAKTFFGLMGIADIDHSPQAKITVEKPPEENVEPEINTENNVQPTIQLPSSSVKPSLHYNIQIHLPATKDIEVYNSIFKSLKEHLLG